MEGFLRGKCVPRDLKVNETNAEYLVRKFAEAEAKCAALAERIEELQTKPTPDIALALLDEINALEETRINDVCRIAELTKQLESAKSKLNEQREYYEGVISDGSKRIAKLESNEVREDGNQFLVVRHPGKTPVIKHCTGDLEEFLRQLIEQDPLVTIDIITHRYYGVGGQWVQDAGEYLHMMSDAGIRIKGE
ncbi:ead/Ea22-like family protein [Salmonella enterica subsp. enterica serovar Johannesburg]|nr:ead/Ea22-like family protein [Salmonella enterica]EGI6445634.1 ead/Ea22-like family protein [Salmonella enterica subsp. enterica serovar Johannesburg]EJH8445569.1 ead/Ea22-like family protein [Escherichia coli]EAP7812002.1 ead/Ea22-like family protein [Salmonella enterica]EAU0589660.1 ead/Ea22-like family protein [Salmonella enterica]